MVVPILKQGDILIASIQAALTDADLVRLRDDLVNRVATERVQGVVIDVSVLDVMDSFACNMLRAIADMIRLQGAETVVVGIRPDVAFSMVQLGIRLDNVHTALDLDEGLRGLRKRGVRSSRGSPPR